MTSFAEATQRVRPPRRTYTFSAPPEVADSTVHHVPIIIVGAGPIGLAMGAELAQNGVQSIILERDNTSSNRSRAVCWSKRTLEILDRLGIAERMLSKGVTWNVGKVFCGTATEPLYTFDLLPLKEQQFPAFSNLQQYYTEEFLVDSLADSKFTYIRWSNSVTGVTQYPDYVEVTIDTPEGQYFLRSDYLLAADGAYSPIRQMLGLDFDGRTFEDNFLIVDFKMQATLPAERRFFFNAPFNAGRTALMHRQPDDVWRLDFQLGWNIDREAALDEEAVTAKIRAVIGDDVPFQYEWISIYTFQCRRMERFVHDRVIFLGDAAHLVSPFGARGANGGIQDVDNLGWKLAHVLRKQSPRTLLESYDVERLHAADENIRNSTRATDFMTPKTPVELALRDAVLELTADYPFARALVNSGRLSVPCSLEHSPLITADSNGFNTPGMWPGTVALDAPIQSARGNRWLMRELGRQFVCLVFAEKISAGDLAQLPRDIAFKVISNHSTSRVDDIDDVQGLVATRYDGTPGTTYLIRPDQHIAARWRHFDVSAIITAWQRSLGQQSSS